MSKIRIYLNDGEFVYDGKQITFKTPCTGSQVTSLIIEDTEYRLVDSCNRDVSGCAYSFVQYAFVSVLLDTKNKKAYIINAGQHKLSSDLATGTFVVAKSNKANNATNADNATNASHAASADNADNATNASHAASADNATNADRAIADGDGNNIANTYVKLDDLADGTTPAYSATYDSAGNYISYTYARKDKLLNGELVPLKATSADHAKSADNATNASHATNADHAKSADNATNASHATSADNATQVKTERKLVEIGKEGTSLILQDNTTYLFTTSQGTTHILTVTEDTFKINNTRANYSSTCIGDSLEYHLKYYDNKIYFQVGTINHTCNAYYIPIAYMGN